MSRQQPDLVELAVTYALEKKYPKDCPENVKRSVRRKADSLVVKDGEVYCLKARKQPNGKKVSYACIYSYNLLDTASMKHESLLHVPTCSVGDYSSAIAN